MGTGVSASAFLCVLSTETWTSAPAAAASEIVASVLLSDTTMMHEGGRVWSFRLMTTCSIYSASF
jgi:hypothetical protein